MVLFIVELYMSDYQNVDRYLAYREAELHALYRE
jgi:hypothetical protein